MATPVPHRGKTRHSYADYAALPEGVPYQLIDGDLIMTPAPNTYHQRVLKQLGFLLVEFIEKTYRLGEVFLAPTDVYFGEMEVYQPDIIVVARDRLDIIGEVKIEGAPDLVSRSSRPPRRTTICATRNPCTRAAASRITVFSNLKMSLKRVIESPLERRTPGPQGMPGGVVSLGSAVAVHGCVERVVAVPCVTVLPPHCRLFP